MHRIKPICSQHTRPRCSAVAGMTILFLLLCLALPTGCDGSEPECGGVGIACTWVGIPGEEGFNGDGRDRLDTRLYWAMDMIFTDDGTPWFIDWNNHLVRRVLPDDTIETAIGWTDPVFPGDGERNGDEYSEQGAEGDKVQLNHPTDLAIEPDGQILLMAWHNHKLRRFDPVTGRVWIVAGAGAGFRGDGGPAGSALFKQPDSVEVDSAGNIYIGDQQNQRVRRIDTSGIIDTIAGNGTQGYGGDSGPALDASFNWEVNSNPEPSGGLAMAGDLLYVSDTLNNRIRVIDLQTGIIDTVAGSGQAGYGGDGGPATDAQLDAPRDIEIGPDGHLYIADTDNSAIRAVDLESGIIRTVAGTGELGLDPKDGLLATETMLKRPFGVAFDAEGTLYVMDTINSRILRIEQ
jgi:sugar lactone lactonase YvrE